MSQFEKREFLEIERTVYAITDDYGHTAELSPKQAQDLLQWLIENTVEGEDEQQALLALLVLFDRLDVLRSTETSDIVIPGPQGKWNEAIDLAYKLRGRVERFLEVILEELDEHHQREAEVEDRAGEE